MVLTVEEWRALFDQVDTTHAKMLIILDHINGYGTEYGFNSNDDAEDLATAFEALQPRPYP